jgi:hypothetical protein
MYMKSLLAMAIGQIFQSCSPTFQYGPANLGTESQVFISPANKDGHSIAQYAGGGYSFNLGKGYYDGESSRYAEALYHVAYAGKYISCATGTGIFGGSYRVNAFRQDPGWKNYYGLQGSMQVAANLPITSFINWRILGFRSGFALEDGELFDFRMKYRNYPGFAEFSRGRMIGNAGGYSEIMVNYRDIQAGVYYSNSVLFGKEKFLGLASSYAVYAGYNSIFVQYRYTASTTGNQSRSLGLIYRFR